MLTHADIQAAFEQAFPGAVHLVARYSDAALDLPGGRAHIFLPDFHLLNHEDAKAYPKSGFKQGDDLLTLLKRLAKLKNANPALLHVWHLGDIFDIWRARGGLGPAAEVNKIAADYAEIVDRLRMGPPFGVRARIMAGNHDYPLHNLAEWRAARFRLIENDDPEAGDVLVLHGDVFSWVEGLPDEIQARAVRFARWVSSGNKDLFNDEESIAALNRELPVGDRAIGEPKSDLFNGSEDEDGTDDDAPINVIEGDRGHPKAKNKKFFKGAKALADAFRERGHHIRLMVIGHTHMGRIIHGALDESGSEEHPFVLMDCGSWYGTCRLAPDGAFIHSAQVGVLVENEVRLYQFGHHEAE